MPHPAMPLIGTDNLISILLLMPPSTLPLLPHSHYSRVIYNAQHPHHPRLTQSSSDYGSPSTNDFATYQNYASTASTVSTLAQFNYNNPESYPYTPTTPPTTATDISNTKNRLELSASALASAAAGGDGRGVGGRSSASSPRSSSGARHSAKDNTAGHDEEPFASIRIQVSGQDRQSGNYLLKVFMQGVSFHSLSYSINSYIVRNGRMMVNVATIEYPLYCYKGIRCAMGGGLNLR